jgi:predicted nucleic acid-binding protein
MIAVDTNVFVYAIDADDAAKQGRALDLLSRLSSPQPRAVQLWQVACEFLSHLRKRSVQGQLTVSQVEASFQRFLALFPLQLPSEAVLHRSSDLMAKFSLSHWDALLLAACKEAGVSTLYSEDMQAGMNYDGVSIVNPFV